MAKSNTLFLLISIYTALIAFAVASTTTTTRVNNLNRGGATTTTTTTTSCGPGSDEPQCNDLSYENAPNNDKFCDSREYAGDQHQKQRRRHQLQQQHRRTQREGSNRQPHQHQQQSTRFQPGDVIELYNTASTDVQIIFPSLVKGHDPSGYRVTKTTDGKEVSNIPDRQMHLYQPYEVGSEALCNIGEFKPARPVIVRCTVLGYEAAARRGAMVLQGMYEVKVHTTKENEEYETNLPVWKLQRRYQAAV